jgi:hypothetical protein
MGEVRQMSEEVSVYRRVILVGELNPFGTDPRLALYHLPRRSSGNRLRVILGLSDAEYARIPKANLCEGRWRARDAHDRARRLLADPETLVYVLLGKRVRDAFRAVCGVAGLFADFSTYRDSGNVAYTLVALPHPSGLCRVWNDPGAAELARDLLRRVAPRVPWGSYSEKVVDGKFSGVAG